MSFNMINRTIVIICILLFSYCGIAFAQDRKMGIASSDSVRIGQYFSVRQTELDSLTGISWQTMNFSIGSKNILTVKSPLIGLIDFCFCYEESLNNCYAVDLNKDGSQEIGILRWVPGTSNYDSSGFAIYTLRNDSAILDNNFLKVSYVDFKKVTADSLPELIFSDYYLDSLNLPSPSLIWQWHDGKYKQANFKFPDYILPNKRAWEIGLNELKSYDDSLQYSPQSLKSSFPSGTLDRLMLTCFYAGKSLLADSIMEEYWPYQIPGKNEYYQSLLEIIHADPYWPQIQDSNW